jgi:hypothetical protein
MSKSLGNASSHRKAWGLVVSLAAAVAVVGYFTVGMPPATDETAGTIAPASRYRAEQVGTKDITLGDETIQQLMQTALFDRLVRDKEFRDTFASDDFNDVLVALNAELNSDLNAGEMNAELNSDLNAGEMNARLNSDLNAGEMNARLNSDLNAGEMNAGLNSDLNAGEMNARLNSDLNAGEMNARLNSDLNAGEMNARLNSDLNAGLNSDLNAGLNAGLNSDLNAELRDILSNADLRDAVMNGEFRNMLAGHALNIALNNETLSGQQR